MRIMTFPARVLLTAAWLAALGAACLPSSSYAQGSEPDWPVRPVRFLIGSPTGGGTDIMARAVADRLSALLGQSVLVESRPGASNTLAVDLTAKSRDGHTAVVGTVTGHAIAPHLLKLGYDNNRDLTPVALIASVPNVLVVSKDLPVQSVQELIALAKAQPGVINFASSGVGSSQHIAAEIFKDAAGVDMVHVPYKGSAAAQVDLIAGRVQLSFDTMASAINQIGNGNLRALAVTTAVRNAQLPDVPTLAEVGLTGVEMSTWYGLYVPAAMPAAVVQRLNTAVNQVLAMPETRARLTAVGAELRPMSQADFAAFHLAEYQRFGEIIRKNGITLD